MMDELIAHIDKVGVQEAPDIVEIVQDLAEVLFDAAKMVDQTLH